MIKSSPLLATVTIRFNRQMRSEQLVLFYGTNQQTDRLLETSNKYFSSMELSIQAKKRQKVFMIDPNDGVAQFVPTFTAEEEQSFAISQLELWKKADLVDGKDVMDVNHAKLLKFQDISARNSSQTRAEKTGVVDQQEKLKRAVESAQRAAAELSMLVQLTNLIASNKILSLQTCYDSTILAEADEDQAQEQSGSAKVYSPPKVLPIAQIIGIQRNTMMKAQTSLQNGIVKMRQLVQKRNSFADTLRTCTEDTAFALCYVDQKSNKRVLHRKYDPVRDCIAVDCSISVGSASSSAEVSKSAPAQLSLQAQQETNKGGGALGSGSGSGAVNSYVSIHMSHTGLALSTSEQNAPLYTLQVQLILHDEFSNELQVVGEARSWDVLHPSDGVVFPPAKSELESESETSVATGLTRHIQRRKHETLCKAGFAQIKEECIRQSTHWDLLSGTAAASATNNGQLNSAKFWSKLQGVLKRDAISQSIVVIDVQEHSVQLRVSASLQLCISLVPNSCDTHIERCGEPNSWVRNTLASVLLQALLKVLRPTSRAAPQTDTSTHNCTGSNRSVKSSTTAAEVSSADSYWSKVIRQKVAVKDSADQQDSIAQSILRNLKQKVEKLLSGGGSGNTAMEIAP